MVTQMSKTDEQIMSEFQSGDMEALGLLYERLHEPLYCFLIRYTSEQELSIDLVHDTFERLAAKKHLYDEQAGTLRAFVFQMAYRLLINKLNRRKKWRSLLPFLRTKEVDETDHTDRLQIAKALQNLPEQQRAVVLLSYYEDATQTEIAQILNIPVGTVKSRLHHAMKQLKRMLQEDE